MKELVRRAAAVTPSGDGTGFEGWLLRVAQGRRAADLMHPDPADDFTDPYGGPRRGHEAMLVELAALVDQLVTLGPWRRAVTG